MRKPIFLLLLFLIPLATGGTGMELKLSREITRDTDTTSPWDYYSNVQLVDGLLFTQSVGHDISYLLDVTDPLDPTHLLTIDGEFLDINGGRISLGTPLYKDGYSLFMIAETNGGNFYLIEINLYTLILQNNHLLENITDSVSDMLLDGNMLYVSEEGRTNHDPANIHRYDISDHSNPSYDGSFLPYQEAHIVNFIGKHGNNILMLGYSKVIEYNPTLGSIDIKDTILYNAATGKYRMFRLGDYIYGQGNGKLAIYDISDLDNIVEYKYIILAVARMVLADDMIFVESSISITLLDTELNIITEDDITAEVERIAAFKISDNLYIYYRGDDNHLEIMEYSDRVPPTYPTVTVNNSEIESNDNTTKESSAPVYTLYLLVGIVILPILRRIKDHL